MAITKMNETRSASCKFVTGVDHLGKDQYMTRTIANFKSESTLEDVYEVVVAVAGLYPYSATGIFLNERCEMVG